MVYLQPLLVLAIVFLAVGIGLAIGAQLGLDFPYLGEVIKALIIIGFIFLVVWTILVIISYIRAA